MPGTDDSLIGQRILGGGYVVTRLIGQGGMGAVYVAENEQLGKKLALKILLPELSANQQIVERFIAEAKAASAIDHPAIIDVIDAGQLDDGRHYILMEFLDGDSLEGYIQGHGPLAIDVTLQILVQVCAGLEAAHQKGIIHRDLKPANVFVSPRVAKPLFTKILDFGIAKLGDQALAGGIKTGTNVTMGTPSYMSPEQARGCRDVDQRSDIYALGVIAYQMLTNQFPYTATSVGSLVHQQLTQPIPDPRRTRPDLPEAWVRCLVETMNANPEPRPPTARALANRLIEATPGGIELARQASPEFFAAAPADDETTKNIDELSGGHAPVMPAQPATVSLGKPTTLSAAAGVSEVARDAGAVRPRRGHWYAGIGVLAVLGAGGAALGLVMRTSGDAKDNNTEQSTKVVQPVDAAPALAREVTFRVESEPPGATIYVDDEVQLGVAPLDVKLKVGSVVVIRAELAGYHVGSEAVTVSSKTGPVALQLTPKERATSVVAKPASKSTKPKRRKSKTRRPKKRSAKTSPDKPEPTERPVKRGFDPDAPG